MLRIPLTRTLPLVLGALIACSPPAPAPTPRVQIPVGPVPSVAPPAPVDAGPPSAPAGPSKWQLAYSADWSPAARLPLDDGSTLLVGDGGERWLERGKDHQGATDLLPAALVGVQKGDGGYRFVTQTSAIHSSDTPLGPAKKLTDGVPGARAPAIGTASVYVVDDQGALVKSVDGRAYEKVALPSDGAVTAIEAIGPHALVLVAHQQLYFTKDDGVSWSAMVNPDAPAGSVIRRDGGLFLVGKTGDSRFDLRTARFAKPVARGPVIRSDGSRFGGEPVRGVDGNRALSVVLKSGGPGWQIAAGELGAEPVFRGAPELDSCTTIDADLRGTFAVIACSGWDHPDQPLARSFVTKILLSSDGGATFAPDSTLQCEPDYHFQKRVAVGPGGFVFFENVCSDRKLSGARVRTSATAPWVDLPAMFQQGFAFAEDVAYSLGRTFAPPATSGLFRWKRGSPTPELVATMSVAPDSAALSISADGKVHGISSRQGFEWDDKTLTTFEVGVKVRDVALAGNRGLGVVGGQGPVIGGDVYETRDAGRSWTAVTTPAILWQIFGCSALGCATNRGFRIGWDGAR